MNCGPLSPAPAPSRAASPDTRDTRVLRAKGTQEAARGWSTGPRHRRDALGSVSSRQVQGTNPAELPSTSTVAPPSSNSEDTVSPPGAPGHPGSLTVSLGPPGSYSRATGVCRDRTAPSPPSGPRARDERRAWGATRRRPAEGACSPQTPQSSGGTGGTTPAARERGFTRLLLFLKKTPPKAPVLAVTCRCHTRPFQINPRGQKTFSW